MKFKALLPLNKTVYFKTLVLFSFLTLVFNVTSLCQSYPYKFKYLTVDEGLSHTDANHISQDNKGYLWIATNFGLDRYDGYAIKKYYNTNVPINNAQKNRILVSYPDKTGNIWLGTEDGLQCFDPSTEKYIDFAADRKNPNPVFSKLFKPYGNLIYGLADNQLKVYLISGRSIIAQKLNIPKGLQFFDLEPDQHGTICLGTNNGLWRLDENQKLKKINIEGFADTIITGISFNRKNDILVASGDQLILSRNLSATGLFKELEVFKRYILKDYKSITGVVADSKNNYWINTGSALTQLDSGFNFIQTISNKTAPYGLNSTVLLDLFIDRSQCLWACTAGGGLNFCDLNQKLFYTMQHEPGNINSLSGNYIRSVLEDGENLWIGTNANGLNLFNFKTQKFTFYNSYNSPVQLKNDKATALVLDNDHNLWIGGGKGITILKPDREQLLQPPGYAKFPNYEIETLAKDCYGNIWFGNHYKMGVIWKDNQNHYRVKEYSEGHFILTDDEYKPLLFVASRHGLKQLVIDKEGNIKSSTYYTASLKANSLSSSYISPIRKQNDSTYWVGTIGGGLNKLSFTKGRAPVIKHFAQESGIFNDVEALEIDDAGNLWMGGNSLICMNPVTGKLIRYDKSDGLQGNSFKVRASYKGASGRLYFGGINGLNYFYPSQIKPNKVNAAPLLTGILINNQEPNYNNSDSAKNYIGKAIGYNNDLKLNYLQNNFVLFFSAMHFANPLKCKYRYKLIGFDNDWRYTDGKRPNAAYSNLDYKNYRFVVEATNNDGLWSTDIAETAITITPPWWKSGLAKAIYALLFLSALLAIYIYQARWYRLKREIEVRALNEKKREEMHLQREEMHVQREELYQQQLMFFTNISHEFRTPLTLILGPLENLITQNKNTALDNSYQLMLRNAKRLVNLISELMNFKKVSDSLIKLQVKSVIIDQFCENLAQEFQNLADNKSINFKMTVGVQQNISLPISGLFDVQVLEKILFNLLSNAFKYTPAGGLVSFELLFNISQLKPVYNTAFKLLSATRAKRYVYFRVIDSGIGISADSINRIFDRYYRISKDHLGSGVGLALVKSLTELHKGDIYVYSERNKGTEIIIGIPWGDENYNDIEKAIGNTESEPRLEFIDNTILGPLAQGNTNNHPVIPKSNKRVLIVDDNRELRIFLKQTLEIHYYIYEAESGYEAIEITTEKLPDLIISDVMMPGMSGIEFCRIVKEKNETRHIPLIILSAKDALESKIEGLESGADLYFAKPLNVSLLLLTIGNIFEQNEKLKLRHNNDYLLDATKHLKNEKDSEFSAKLLKVIEEHIQNADLDVDFLCRHLYISRTKLYQQIKVIADQSVGDFIRTIRLKKAIHIMTHEDVAMSEVADRIGLQSSSNFSRAFKKEYGKSPLQFIQSLKKS